MKNSEKRDNEMEEQDNQEEQTEIIYFKWWQHLLMFFTISTITIIGFIPLNLITYAREGLDEEYYFWIFVLILSLLVSIPVILPRKAKKQEKITLKKFLDTSFIICTPFFIVMPFMFFHSIFYNLIDGLTLEQHISWFTAYLDTLFIMGALYFGVYLFFIMVGLFPFEEVESQ